MTRMLTDDELACARHAADEAFPETVLIRRPTRAADGAGGSTTTWATVATVKGLLSPAAGGTEQTLGSRDAGAARYTIRVAGGTDVRRTDQLKIGGRTFEVIDPGGPHSLDVVRAVLVVEVT